ncbi:endodeoxyribonuclease RusA [Mesorhizobium sp. ORS 3428]|nr:endodeoxyribonuclease RusA [Mesorhizobium sp. ORS 3428]
MEIKFPVEFTVLGTPVSFQAKRAASKEQWKARVRAASTTAIPQPHFVSDERIAVTLYYLPEERVEGDVDNIVKLVLDALCKHIYLDDAQVERVVVQKFEPGNVFDFRGPSAAMVDALNGAKPALYVRVSNDPFEDLR